MIHCDAGVSRSPAVAAALETIFYGRNDKWFEDCCPNVLVYRMILEVAKTKGLFSGEVVIPERKEKILDSTNLNLF